MHNITVWKENMLKSNLRKIPNEIYKGQQIKHQIYFSFIDMICEAINYILVNKNSIDFSF